MTQKDADKENVTKDLYRFGTVAKILQAVRMPDGSMKVLIEGAFRASIVKLSRHRSTQAFSGKYILKMERCLSLLVRL